MTNPFRFFAAAACLSGAVLAVGLGLSLPLRVHAGSSWDVKATAQRMDQRQQWWMQWPKAQRDHGTACVSCHTVLPYAMGRSSLRQSLGEAGPSPTEQTMLGYVIKRVNGWNEMEPFYNDAKSGPRKSVESRGTESVLNALVLARYDSATGILSPATRAAFRNMWALQLTTGEAAGAWDWLNFHLAPWETDTSQYYGAVLSAIAVGSAPQDYAQQPDIQPGLRSLVCYLQLHYQEQPLLNRTVLLWASGRLPELLSKQQKQALIQEILQHQAPDGGWSVASLGTWKRKDDTPAHTESDGYATGLTVYALRQAGYPRGGAEMQQAVQWLIAHQAPEGSWAAMSLNKERDPKSDPALFMSDSATGFAALALQSLAR